jgi:hypothetical protein
MVIVIILELILHDSNIVLPLSGIVVTQTVCMGDIQQPPSEPRRFGGVIAEHVDTLLRDNVDICSTDESGSIDYRFAVESEGLKKYCTTA